MAPGEAFISGGYNLFVSKRSLAGFPMGQLADPEAPVAGTGYGAYLTKALISTNGGTPQFDTAQERAGQTLGVKRELGVNDYGTPNVVLSRRSEILDGIIKNYTPDTTTLSSTVITADNVRQVDPVPLALGYVIGANEKEYITRLFHNAVLRRAEASSSQSGGVNPNPLTHEIVPSPSVRAGNGMLLSAFDLDLADEDDISLWFRAPYPYYLYTYVADAGDTGFTLPLLPISSDTGGTSNLFAKAGVKTSVTSVSTTTGAVVIPAQTGGEIWTAFYQTKGRPSS